MGQKTKKTHGVSQALGSMEAVSERTRSSNQVTGNKHLLLVGLQAHVCLQWLICNGWEGDFQEESLLQTPHCDSPSDTQIFLVRLPNFANSTLTWHTLAVFERWSKHIHLCGKVLEFTR